MYNINKKRHVKIVIALLMLLIALSIVPAFAEEAEESDIWNSEYYDYNKLYYDETNETNEINEIFDKTPNSEAARDEFKTYGATTNYFNVEITVNKDYSYNVKEEIGVILDRNKHGIIRSIPLTGNYKINDIQVPFETYNVNIVKGNKVITIGSPDRTVFGRKRYEIEYKIENYVTTNADKQININVIPTNWEMIIMNANVTVKLPDDFPYSKMKSYVGKFGSTKQTTKWKYDKKSNTLNYKATMLPANYGVTLQVDTPKNYWVDVPSNRLNINFNMALLLIIIIIIAVFKYANHKNKDLIIPVMFNPPDGITSAELGYLADEVIDNEDIVSLYLYLASKGYIKIEDNKDKHKIMITSLKTPENEENYVNDFYVALFDSTYERSVGIQISIDDAGKKLGKSIDKICTSIIEKFEGDKSFYSEKSKERELTAKILGGVGIVSTLLFYLYRLHTEIWDIPPRGIILITAICILSIGYIVKKISYRKMSNASKNIRNIILFGILYGICAIALNVYFFSISRYLTPIYLYLAFIIYLILLPFLINGIKVRSDYNRNIFGQIVGFKNFIETVELDRLNELVDENPSYFYDVLPYAYVFKLTDKWISKFNNISVPNHCSYTSFGQNALNPMIVNTMISNIELRTEIEVSKTYPGRFMGRSRGSGFTGGGGGFRGGGGFSGGGVGGGGGGAW